jgi:hypothetical protein
MTYRDFRQRARRRLGLLAWLLAELRNRARQARHLPARVVLVNDVALRRTHQLGLGAGHRLQRRVAVAALDRFLDVADGAAHLGAARLVDHGAAGDLAGRLLGGSRVGHRLKNPLAETAGVQLRTIMLSHVTGAGCVSERLRDAVAASNLREGPEHAQRNAAAGLRPPPLPPL